MLTEYLSRMSYQRAFNKVYKHLMKQNRRCENIFGCLYRGPGGMKCAIGVLIPDSLYNPSFEGDKIHVFCPGLSVRRKEFYTKLQKIHDDWPIRQWDSALKDLAHRYNLKVPA